MSAAPPDEVENAFSDGPLEGLDGQAVILKKDGAPPKSPLSGKTLVFMGIAFFFLFLLLKLPNDRIQEYLVAHMKIQAQRVGYGIKVEKLRFTFITGPKLKMTGVELHSIHDENQNLQISELEVRPQLTSLFFPLKKFSVSAKLADTGELSGNVGISANELDIDLDATAIEIGKIGVLRMYTYVELYGVADGSIKLNIDQNQPQSSSGLIKLEVSKLRLPTQSVMGFTLPDVSISHSSIETTIDKGRIAFKDSYIGKDAKNDDIIAHITGDGTLMPNFERTQINLKIVLDLSPRLLQKLPILENLLGSARGASGKYTYRLIGPLYALETRPGE